MSRNAGAHRIEAESRIPPATPQPHGALIQELAWARHSQKLLDRGAVGTKSEIAEAETISTSCVSQILPLALLAQAFVEAFSSSNQPSAALPCALHLFSCPAA